MDGRNLATTFAASPIHHPIYHQAAVSGAPGPLPTHQQALTTPPPPQGPLVMEMVQQPQGAPVMDVFPTMAALQPPQAGATMGPTMTATQLIQAVEMIARLPVPTAAPDFFDMPSGQQMTGCEQDMAEFNESIELPFVPNIHNETPSIDFYERSLPSNASDTLYVEGLPSNCTIRELTHLFRHFTGFSDLRLVHGGIDNTYLIALVEFNTPIQAFSVMEYLQGECNIIVTPSHVTCLTYMTHTRTDCTSSSVLVQDITSGHQMTVCQQEIAGFNESMELPYGPYIYNEMHCVDSHERSLPSNASNTLYVEGLPSNCTIRELTRFSELRLVHGGIDNTYLIALVEFNTPIQAFSVMEYLQGECNIIVTPSHVSYILAFHISI